MLLLLNVKFDEVFDLTKFFRVGSCEMFENEVLKVFENSFFGNFEASVNQIYFIFSKSHGSVLRDCENKLLFEANFLFKDFEKLIFEDHLQFKPVSKTCKIFSWLLHIDFKAI